MSARTRARRCVASAVAAVFLLVLTAEAPDAVAAWSANGNGGSGAAATIMPTGFQPVVRVSGNSVTVRWPAATLPGGTPVSGYLIARYDAASGAAATVGPGCGGVVTATTCTELNVPSGTWVYSDTPIQANWSGPASPLSAAVPVA